MRTQISGLALAAAGLTMLTSAAYAECGDIQMAEWNWASGELMANVDKFILENGYGCDVEMIPGATTTTFASMNEKGQPDVAGELWINAVREPLGKALEEVAGADGHSDQGNSGDAGEQSGEGLVCHCSGSLKGVPSSPTDAGRRRRRCGVG